MNDLFVIACQTPLAEAYPLLPGARKKRPCSPNSKRHRLFLRILRLFLLLPNHKSFKMLTDRLTCCRLQVAPRTLNDRMPMPLERVLAVTKMIELNFFLKMPGNTQWRKLVRDFCCDYRPGNHVQGTTK